MSSVTTVASPAPTPIAENTPPDTQRNRVIGRVCTAACRRASSGLTPAARRAAAQLPSRAMTGPAAMPTAIGQRWSRTANDSGSKPASTSTGPRAGATSAPTTEPATDATTPTVAASASTIRLTCRGVAPTARSSPSSRLR
jgi:hypothetical protein